MPRHHSRPVSFLNPLRIEFPPGAIVSLLHRVSGVILFVGTPAALYLLQLTLSGPEGFALARALLETLPARCATALIAWAFAHHLAAGVRLLLLDLGIGVSPPHARATARLALLFALTTALWVVLS